MSQHNITSVPRGAQRGTPLFVHTWWDKKQIVSGVLGDDQVFRRRFDYLLETPPAICLDAENVDQLAGLGCNAIKLTHRPSGITYEIDFRTFRSMAVETNRGKAGRQYFVTLSNWKASAAPAVSRPASMLAQHSATPQRPGALQLGLF